MAYKNTSILLKGFVYHHQETCNDETCPLMKTKQQMDSERLLSERRAAADLLKQNQSSQDKSGSNSMDKILNNNQK